MAARAQVHHQRNMFDSSSSDFSSSFSSSSDFSADSDSSSSGGDFMDKYITEVGEKPMQIDSDKPKVEKQDAGIPDMASLFSDNSNANEEKPNEQEPWRSQSTSSSVDNLFSGSFGNFDAPAKDSWDAPKPSRSVDSTSSTDDMTNLFGGSSGSAVSAPSETPSSSSDSMTSGWPWDTPAKKKEPAAHHSRDLWSDSSDSSSSSGNSASNDMVNMFGGSSGGSTGSTGSDSAGGRNLFDEWSSFGGNAGTSQPAHAPQQQDDAPQRSADSPIQGPAQREGSIAGASAHDQVVDVRLSSELQQSLLQARNAESQMLRNFRGVSN